MRWFVAFGFGVGRGDEVFSAELVRCIYSVVHIGAKPVFVDVLDDQNIDPEKIENAITPRTKAIMPVHLTGHGKNGRGIRLPTVMVYLSFEDAAQSIGATYMGRMSG